LRQPPLLPQFTDWRAGPGKTDSILATAPMDRTGKNGISEEKDQTYGYDFADNTTGRTVRHIRGAKDGGDGAKPACTGRRATPI